MKGTAISSSGSCARLWRNATAGFGLGVTLLVLLVGGNRASAYWPPVQDITSSVDQVGINLWRVNFSVQDPETGTLQATNSGVISAFNVALDTRDGVVGWLVRQSSAPNSNYQVGMAVYEPGRGGWRMTNSAPFSAFNVTWLNRAGVVTWLARATSSASSSWNVTLATFDPMRDWQIIGSGGFNAFDVTLANQDGVVAWLTRITSAGSSDWLVSYGIYDPSRGSWRPGNSGVFNAFSAMFSVSNASVTFSGTGTTNRTQGYNASSGNWYNGITKPLASFVASTNLGAAPLTIWFTDMSIGGTSWSWTFGDGGGSTARSPSHTFAGSGGFTVAENVTGPAGNSSTSAMIVTDATAPTGTIEINGGDAFTTNTLVTLTLSAQDPNGPLSMRFSNTGTNWTDWEAFATSKTWTLTSGDGVKTVFVEFKDGLGNVSAPFSDMIQLDTQPLPSVGWQNSQDQTAELDTVVTNAVILSGPSTRTVTVDFAVSAGTASAGQDFVATNGTLTFQPGETNAAVAVHILDDSQAESDETVVLVLANPVNGILATNASATITILENDNQPVQPVLHIFRPASGQPVRVTIQGPAGHSYILEASENLPKWQPLVTLTNRTGMLEFSEPILPEVPRHFFRVRVSD